MVSNRGPVGPRVPKEEFMRALGLDLENADHESYYRAMRVCEAVIFDIGQAADIPLG